MLWLVVILGIVHAREVLGANILILEGLASPSHHVFMRVINEALARQGHNVTSISADVEANPVANLTYLHNDKVYEHIYQGYDPDGNMNLMEFGSGGNLATIIEVDEFYRNTLTGIKKSKGYQQLLAYPDDFKFDLIIYDYMALPVLLGFHHKFRNPPLIGLTAFNGISPSVFFVGSSFYPAYIPFYFGSGFRDTFFGRIENTFLNYFDYFFRNYCTLPKMHSMVKDDFPGLPPLSELERQMRLVLINYSPAVHDPEPMLPNVIPIAGMHMQQIKPLPKDFQEILDNAKNGVILFSLGTNVKSWMLGEERIQKFVNAFRKLPQYTFIWKFDNEEVPNVPKNVIIKKWVPQNDILDHPNAKLFMSHCGLLSTLESTWHGVPILGIPIFLDQFTNAELLQKSGISETIFIKDVTTEEIAKVIAKMMTSSNYRNNAKIRSQLFRDQPQPPLERALWHIDFILRNPDVEFLRSKSIHLDIFTRHNVDVIVFVVVILMIFLCVVRKILKLTCGRRKSSNPLKQKTN
ncbi:UDP-glycosyltransferase UGT4-like [Phlebotomus argentipes]|uniref:UDP-glycosyltransferase UGT4-like n=1 Tax=Phlebotomus argentipes TaxID=94469 RepID=UPI002892F7D1|nr:UDP-glycosyltransferase UGT4-like [Phlebotomus argentipes]